MKDGNPTRRYILLVGLILLGLREIAPLRAVVAQNTPTSTWEITQNLCPTNKGCRQIRHISPDGQKLFFYIYENRMLHVFSHDALIQSYDMTNLFPWSQDNYFDFLPINNHVLVYFDRERDRLASVDIETQTNQTYVVEHGMRSCTSNITSNAPFPAFYLLPDHQTLIICRVDLVNNQPHISKINLETNQLEDILVLENTVYPYAFTRVVAGLDGAIYIGPAGGQFWNIVPGYPRSESSDRHFARWDIETASWSFLKVTDPLLTSAGSLGPPSLIGVDQDSNLYFWKVTYENHSEADTLIKTNINGNVIGQITNEELGLYPTILDIQPDGRLMVINGTSFEGNTMAGMQINTVVFPELEITPTLSPSQTSALTATFTPTETPTSTNPAIKDSLTTTMRTALLYTSGKLTH
jgi:hypothetical protein